MDKQYISLDFKAKVKPIEKLNEEFTLCKCFVQGVGKNRNMSYMSKENIIKNSPTLKYAPVVGHLIKKEDGGLYMGGHDVEIDDDWNMKSACVPYGVVTNDDFGFEMVEEYGEQVEYMTANVILWTGRYPELMEAIYADDFYFNQSMELSLSQYRPYEEDSNYMELLDWTYSALCMLGKADDKNSVEHTEPCFIESKIVPIQYSFSKSDFSESMAEMKKELEFYFKKEGVDTEMDNFEEVVETVEEVVEPEEVVEEPVVVVEEPVETENHDVEEEPEVVECEPEVIEEEPEVEMVEASMLAALREEYDEYISKHQHTNEEFDNLHNEYAELKEFKDNYDAAQLKEAKDEVFNREEFAEIRESDAFKALVADAEKFSVAEVEAKVKTLFADHMIAQFAANKPTETKPTAMKFAIKSKDTANNKPYGTLFDKE